MFIDSDALNLLGPIGLIWFILDWVIRISAIFFVPKNRTPTAGMAWLLFIFFFPVLGLIVYLVLGNPKLPKRRREAQKTLDKIIANLLQTYQKKYDKQKLLSAKPPTEYQNLATLSESLTKFPVFDGNKVTVLPEYNEAIDSLVKDIDKAKHYVHLEYFIIVLDEITLPLFEALARAVERGVIVRVLYDSLSTKRYPKWKQMLNKLEGDGILVQPLLPVRFPGRGYVRPDLRNHRKLAVIDGLVGYTGSQNMVRRDYHRKDDLYYDELVVRINGPIVMQLSAVFLTDWYSETNELLSHSDIGFDPRDIKKSGDSILQVLPSGPGYDDENNLKLFTSMIHTANKEILLVNPYFVPHDSLITALSSAAKRGVKVTMINSEAIDQWMVAHAQRSFYESLLKSGIDIFLYKAPILLHSKFIVIDSNIATIGSSNLDLRSFYLNLEVTLIAYDPKVAKQLRSVGMDYKAKSRQVHLSEWQKRPRRKQLLDNIARLTSAVQ